MMSWVGLNCNIPFQCLRKYCLPSERIQDSGKLICLTRILREAKEEVPTQCFACHLTDVSVFIILVLTCALE